MKFLGKMAIVAAGIFGLLIAIGMLAPKERRTLEANVEASTGSSGSATSPPAAPSGHAAPKSDLTAAQRNAARSAESYLKMKGFSRQGLIDQLSSEYGDKYSVADATVAVDSLSVDWNTQAERSAASYLKMKGFSCQGLIDQLSSEYGDKYTVDQARHGATRAGVC